jgi:hypothetical protein
MSRILAIWLFCGYDAGKRLRSLSTLLGAIIMMALMYP